MLLISRLLLLLLLLPFSFLLAEDPTNLRTDSIVLNVHVGSGNSLAPTYCWDFPYTTTNWQVQVDDSSTFYTASDPNIPPACTTSLGQVFFWDSSTSTSSIDSGNKPLSATCVRHRSFEDRKVNGCVGNASLEYRPSLIYWRVRVRYTDPVLGPNTWSNWVSTSMKLNFPPLWPETVSAAVDGATNTDSLYNPAAAVSPTTYYLDADDSTAADVVGGGTTGDPFQTFQFAVDQLIAGDTLIVRDGINYNGTVFITGGPAHSGTATSPITVQSDGGANPLVVSSEMGISIGDVSNWIINGIDAVSTHANRSECSYNEARCSGIVISNSSNIVIKNYTTIIGHFPSWQTTKTPNNAIYIINNSTGVRVTDSLFNQSIGDFIDYGGGNDLTIQGNEFTTVSISQATENMSHAVHLHPGAHGNVLMDSNYFHEMNVAEGAVFNYKGSFARYTNNVFFDIVSTQSNGYGVLCDRSGPIQFENNTCYDMGAACVVMYQGTGPSTFRNNIVAHAASLGTDQPKGFVFGAGDEQLGSTIIDAIVDNNLFRNMYLGTPNNYPITTTGGNSVTLFNHTPTGNIANTDPNFASIDPSNFATTFLRIETGSAAKNAGHASIPVPTLGGATADIGRFEFGETNNSMYKLYTYQPEVANLMDSTPKFSWVLRDEDNILDTAFNFLPLGDTDYQTRFQIQIDESPRFNTLSAAHPLIDSGSVTSTSLFWTLPQGRALVTTKDYYVRVRQADDKEPTTWGPWSDATWAVGMDDDLETAAPILVVQLPAPNSVTTLCSYPDPLEFRFTVRDEGSTMDCNFELPNTCEITIDGGLDQCGSNMWSTGGNTDKTCTFTQYISLAPGDHTIRFRQSDALSNELDTGTYTFTCGTPSGGGTPQEPRIYRVEDP